MSSSRTRIGVACVALGCVSSVAHAGPLESLRDVALHPSDPNTFAAVYAEAGGGLLLTHDGGATFQLVCSAAIERQRDLGTLAPNVSFTADGELLAATFDGLFRADERGCDFQRVETFGDAFITQVLRDPEDASRHYLLTSSGGRLNALYASRDHGQSWSALGAPEDAYFQRLLIAPRRADKRRFYLSVAVPSDGGRLTQQIRVSDDEARSFATQAFPAATDVQLLGLDRSAAECLYAAAVVEGRPGQLVFANCEAASTAAWRELFGVGAVGGFVALPEGGFLLLDRAQHALLRWRPEAEGVETLSTSPNLSCLAAARESGRMFVCHTWQLSLTAQADPEAGQVLLDLNAVTELAACDDDDRAARCAEPLMYGWCGPTHYPVAPVCAQYTRETTRDPVMAPMRDAGATRDAGGDDETAATGGRCSVGWSKHARTGWLWLCVLFAAALRFSRRTKARLMERSRAARPPRSSGVHARAVRQAVEGDPSCPAAWRFRRAHDRSTSGRAGCVRVRRAPRARLGFPRTWGAHRQAARPQRAARPTPRRLGPGWMPDRGRPRRHVSRDSTSPRSRACTGSPNTPTRTCRCAPGGWRPGTETHMRLHRSHRLRSSEDPRRRRAWRWHLRAWLDSRRAARMRRHSLPVSRLERRSFAASSFGSSALGPRGDRSSVCRRSDFLTLCGAATRFFSNFGG